MEDDLFEDDILDEVSDDEDDEGFLGNDNDNNQEGDVAMGEAVREAPRRARNHAAVDDEPPLEGYVRYAFVCFIVIVICILLLSTFTHSHKHLP